MPIGLVYCRRHLFHDSLSALANLLTSLNLKHSMIEKLTSVPDSNCTFYDLLEVLVEELSSESLNEVELQAGIRNVLSMIAMFAGKEFRRSKEEKGDYLNWSLMLHQSIVIHP